MKNQYLPKIVVAIFCLGILVACDDDSVDPINNYPIPTTYSFEDAQGNNTVSFSGQTARLNQLSEITSYLKTANTPGVALDASQLLEMYSNNNGEGSDYYSENAKAPGKQLKNKTVRGIELYTQKFEGYFNAIAEISATTVTDQYDAKSGTAGVLQSGTKAYLVNAKGVEYTQLIEKGLMGAVFYDQIQNVYTEAEKMNVDNETAVNPEEGKYYTTMEHHFDEAFGYFTSETDFPANGTNHFWGKYSTTVDPSLGTNAKIMTAYLTARAAISNQDLDTRDVQIPVIRMELEKVSAGTAIHYLNGGISNFTDDAIRCHELSEAAAFLETLYFTNAANSVFTEAQISEVIGLLEDSEEEYNFYEVTIQQLTEARDKLAEYAGLVDVKTEL